MLLQQLVGPTKRFVPVPLRAFGGGGHDHDHHDDHHDDHHGDDHGHGDHHHHEIVKAEPDHKFIAP